MTVADLRSFAIGVGLFILFYAAQRFCWEFLKPYPRLLGPLDVFQLLALAMIIYALVLDGYTRRNRTR